MKKGKKLKQIGFSLLAIVLLLAVIYVFPPKLWDLRGTVETVSIDDENVWLDVRLTFDETTTKVMIPDGTKIRYYKGEKINPDEIRVGDHISIDIKQKSESENYYTAKKIQID